MHYPETIRPALQVIGAHPAARARQRHVHARHRAARRLLRRHHRQHRSDGRAARADRLRRRRASCARWGSRRASRCSRSRTSARCEHPGGGEDGARRRSCCASATRRSSSTARCRPTRRSTREILGRDYPFSALKEEANVLDLPEPERRQHRLQAAAPCSAARRRSGRSSSACAARCTCWSAAPTCRTS